MNFAKLTLIIAVISLLAAVLLRQGPSRAERIKLRQIVPAQAYRDATLQEVVEGLVPSLAMPTPMMVCRDLLDRNVSLVLREEWPVEDVIVTLSTQLEGKYSHSQLGSDLYY